MSKAARILLGSGLFLFILSGMTCRIGIKLAAEDAQQLGLFMFGTSLVAIFAAGILQAIEWVRKNVRIR